MICITGNMPVLQIGRHQISNYPTDWIEEALHRAAQSSHGQDLPFIADIRDGILHYLQNRCSLKLLTLEELYERMRQMLKKVGCPAIARNLPLVAPPLTISLVEAAQEAGNGFELVFFKILREEFQELHHYGVEKIHFADLAECARILRGRKKDNIHSRQLADDIAAYLEKLEERDEKKRALSCGMNFPATNFH